MRAGKPYKNPHVSNPGVIKKGGLRLPEMTFETYLFRTFGSVAGSSLFPRALIQLRQSPDQTTMLCPDPG